MLDARRPVAYSSVANEPREQERRTYYQPFVGPSQRCADDLPDAVRRTRSARGLSQAVRLSRRDVLDGGPRWQGRRIRVFEKPPDRKERRLARWGGDARVPSEDHHPL